MNKHNESDADLNTIFENCFLRMLSKNYDESDVHAEYDIRKSSLEGNIKKLQEMLEKNDLRDEFQQRIHILSLLFILTLELNSNGPWKSENTACPINDMFYSKYKIKIENLLKEDSEFPSREIFDDCIEKLHLKLTPENFKKYPSFIEVYCSIIYDLPMYGFIDLNPLKVLPASLLLIDDHVPCVKKKGLKCSKAVLSCMSYDDFRNGNYYEVIYGCFKKLITEKDLVINNLVFDCIKELLKSLDVEIKKKKMDELLSVCLDEIYVETNFYRKTALFDFLEYIIVNHQINCVRSKKKFDKVITDNLDSCVHHEIRDTMLQSILQCLEMWIKYCWPLWKYETDQKLISASLKVLYTTAVDEAVTDRLKKFVMLLIMLCNKEEKFEVLKNIEKSLANFQNKTYTMNLLCIKDYIEKNTPL